MIAVMNLSSRDSQRYFSSTHIPLMEVRDEPLEDLGVIGTPTLLIVDRMGIVRHSWTGFLNTQAQQDAMREILGPL